MKKKILIVFLIISILVNMYQIKYISELIDINKTEDINKECYNMYVGYFINSQGLEFSYGAVKQCLFDTNFKTGYNLNGVESKILLDLLNQKDSLNSGLLNKYINALKDRFDIGILTVDYTAMSYALEIINDIEFIKGLIEKSLNGNNKDFLIFYMKQYKRLGGEKEYLLSILEGIKLNIGDYPYYYDDDYDRLKDYFSK